MVVFLFFSLVEVLILVVIWFQPAQEDRREDHDPENKDFEIQEGEEQVDCASPEGKKENTKAKANKESRSAQKTARRTRNSMYCKVSLLDDTIFECSMDVSVCMCVLRPSPALKQIFFVVSSMGKVGSFVAFLLLTVVVLSVSHGAQESFKRDSHGEDLIVTTYLCAHSLNILRFFLLAKIFLYQPPVNEAIKESFADHQTGLDGLVFLSSSFVFFMCWPSCHNWSFEIGKCYCFRRSEWLGRVILQSFLGNHLKRL